MKRPRNLMPDSVTHALEARGLMKAYKERPAYQQNDYIGWINRAKRQETKGKRLYQMLDEFSMFKIINQKGAESEGGAEPSKATYVKL